MLIDTISTLGFSSSGIQVSKQCICVWRWACINACMHTQRVKNTWKACLRACPYACRLFFLSPSAALGKFAGWLCALQSVSGWIMGASGSASGSGNSKCVKRRDCPRSTRNSSWGSKPAARQTPRSSCGPQGQEKQVAHFCWPPCKGVSYRLPPRNTSNFFPATQSTKALQQMFKIRLYLGPCSRLHLVSLSWMIRGRSSALKTPLTLTVCLIII